MYWYGAKLNRSAVVKCRSSANVGVLSGAIEIVCAAVAETVTKRPLAAALLQPPPPLPQSVWNGFGNCEIERSREKTGFCFA